MLGKAAEIAESAWKYHCNDLGSQGEQFALVAEGKRDVFITGGRSYIKEKNTAEELAGMYLIVEEAGGSVTDWKGDSIAENDIGMKQKKSHNVLATASKELARKMSEEIIPEEEK